MSHQGVILYTTFPSEGEASLFIQKILSARLAACIQQDKCMSYFVWDGSQTTADECRLTIKTFARHFDAIASLLNLHHPYDVPELIAVPMTNVSQSYLDWMLSIVE